MTIQHNQVSAECNVHVVAPDDVNACIARVGAPLADIPFKNVLFVAQVNACLLHT